jgi:uncharacterized protein (DUF58 family)
VSLVPPTVRAVVRPFKWAGFAFGSRFFALLSIGLVWVGPGLFQPRFFWVMAGWDLLIVALWAVDLTRLPKPSRLTVERSWLTPVALSVGSHARLTVFNETGTTIHSRVIDAMPSALGESTWMAVVIPAKSAGTIDRDILPRERGLMEVGQVYLHYQSPLRMAERWARADLAQSVVVYPNLDEAKRQSGLRAKSPQIEQERRSKSVRDAGRTFESLREYKEGDELRDICWTASGRRGKLVARRYEIERSQPVWIVIDTGRLMRTRLGGLSKLDHAVNAALTLAQVALTSGDRVGLLTYGRHLNDKLPVARGAQHLKRILDRLALVRTEESEADHLRAGSQLLMEQKRRSLIVWLTDVPDTAMTPEVVRAASQFITRHLVLFVVIGQPDLMRLAEHTPSTSADMYQVAAAQEVAHRRDLLLARLRAGGALVLEALAPRLSPALVNVYLDVKQRNRL